jgi:hypothetical protein
MGDITAKADTSCSGSASLALQTVSSFQSEGSEKSGL